jgi:RHS repeat-associated protein
MRRKIKAWLGIALMALAMSASAFIPRFQPLETFFPESGKTDAQGNVTRFCIWTPLGLVAQIEADGTMYCFHSDELGNTLALTDQTGAVVGQAFYSPYGDTWAQSGSLPTPYRFGGIYGVSTEENDLAYMQNRYYDFGMKRFISADPTGLKGGVNFYTYADGNPLNSIDPEGLCARPSLFGRTSLFGGSQSRYTRTLAEHNKTFAPDPRYDGRLGYVARTKGFGAAAVLGLADLTGLSSIGEAMSGRSFATGNYLSRREHNAAYRGAFLTAGMYAAAPMMSFGRTSARAPVRALASSGDDLARISSRSLTAPRALTTSRITNPARMLPTSNPAQAYAARVPTSPSQMARSLQGTPMYPGVDRFRDITLKKGRVVFGGAPGQSEFYTTASGLHRSGGSSGSLFRGLQVKPGGPRQIHPVTGRYRPGMTAYEVINDSPAAFGRALANPQYGSGRFPQMAIPNYEESLRPLYSIPLVP